MRRYYIFVYKPGMILLRYWRVRARGHMKSFEDARMEYYTDNWMRLFETYYEKGKFQLDHKKVLGEGYGKKERK